MASNVAIAGITLFCCLIGTGKDALFLFFSSQAVGICLDKMFYLQLTEKNGDNLLA